MVKVTITVEDGKDVTVVDPPPDVKPDPAPGPGVRVDELKTITVVIPQPPKPPKLISAKTIEDAIKKLAAEF